MCERVGGGGGEGGCVRVGGGGGEGGCVREWEEVGEREGGVEGDGGKREDEGGRR